MKIYVVYVLADYSSAVFMTTDKAQAQDRMRKLKNRNLKAYIESYDFSKSKSFDLDCD
jgi:hypothetical protein